MINKYAEISDKLMLYNACKGVLRVKMAYDNDPALIKRYEDSIAALKADNDKIVDTYKKTNEVRDRTLKLTEDLYNKTKENLAHEEELRKLNGEAASFNGNLADTMATRGRHVTNIGAAGIGAAGGSLIGGGLGYLGAKRLGLYGKNSTTGKRMLGHLLTGGSALLGGALGSAGGVSVGNHYSNKWFDTSNKQYAE